MTLTRCMAASDRRALLRTDDACFPALTRSVSYAARGKLRMLDLALKHVYYPLLDRSKRAPYRDAFGEAIRNERLSRAELANLQVDKLRALLVHAEGIPFYAERFASAGL